LNPRAGKAAALKGAASDPNGAEFSGSWDVTGLVAKKDDGSFYSKKELAGAGAQSVADQFKLIDHTYVGVVQYRGESGGQVEEIMGDAGGQIFQFAMNDFL